MLTPFSKQPSTVNFLFYVPAFICKFTIPVLLGVCQAISVKSSGLILGYSELFCHKQSKKSSSGIKLRSVKTAYDETDGALEDKNNVLVTGLSTSQLHTIASQIESLVFSQSLFKLDTMLSELNQVQ